jgi:hypothetical protein
MTLHKAGLEAATDQLMKDVAIHSDRARLIAENIVGAYLASLPAPQGPSAQVSEPEPLRYDELVACLRECKKQLDAIVDDGVPVDWEQWRDDLEELLLHVAPTDTGAQGAEPMQPVAVIDQLRAQGWTVAVHNDYRLDGRAHTFWLLTHPSGIWVKGEGATDAEALQQCVEAALAQPQASRGAEK